jgi:hypothetical protein
MPLNSLLKVCSNKKTRGKLTVTEVKKMEPEEFIEKIKKAFARVIAMPEWMQTILLQDIDAAIENRIRTMEIIIQSQNPES